MLLKFSFVMVDGGPWGGCGSHEEEEGRARSSQKGSVAKGGPSASILLASWRVSWLNWMLWRDSAGSSNMSRSVCLGSQPAIFGHVEAVGAGHPVEWTLGGC